MRLPLLLPLLCLLAAGAAPAFGGPEVRIQPSGPVGVYAVERWKTDWPGCEWQDGVTAGRVSVGARGAARVFRVDYATGQIGPEKGGVGWRFPFARCEAAELVYTLRFSPDFDWVKGGKLPGLCGGPENVSGGKPANGANGFSARLMWRADGRGEAYVYHKNQRTNYGDSFPFPAEFRFPTDTEVRLRLRVQMNTPGARNGILQVWMAISPPAAEELVVDRHDLEWRTAETFGVDGLYFDSFHGGGDATWAPTRPCWAEFGQITVARQR
jgi:hypothetical protein